MNSGAQGMNAYSGLVAASGKALGQLAGDSNIARQSLGALAGASSSLITAIFKQSDALFKSYQDISQIGAAGTAGMQGVFDNMRQFGYSMEELPKFGALLAQNSENLARFGGTVEQGVKQFAGVAEGIQRSGLQTEFERMGMSVDSINKGTAAYLKTQLMTGASAAKSQAELTAGAAEYIRQQDILSKLTGKSAETLAKAEEARMAEEGYNAVTAELRLNAEEARASGNEAAAKAFEDQIFQNKKLLDTLPATQRKAAQDLLTGVNITKESQGLSMLNPQMAAKIQSGRFDAADVVETGAKESSDPAQRRRVIALARTKTLEAVMGAGAMQGQTDLAAMNRPGVLTPTQATAAAEATQKGQRETPEAAVANQVAIRQAQREVTLGMNSMVQVGVHPATAALKSFTAGLEAVVTRMPGTGDKTGIRNTPGRGDVKGTGFQGNIIAPEVAEQNRETMAKFAGAANAPAAAIAAMAKKMGQLEKADPATLMAVAAKESSRNQSAAPNQSAAETARLKATSASVQAATPAKTQFSLSSAMASIIEKTNLGKTQYTGPNSTLPSPVGDTTPTGPAAAPATAATTDSGMLVTSLNELLQSNRSQQASLEELIDLSRKSLAQGGKLVQAARQ
jgi:hypothetical protein